MKTLHHETRRSTSVRRTQTAGFALIEVMVAVLLFAIGILGLVGLQASMMQAQTEGKVRTDAANLVDELATLMWSDMGKPANLANLVQYKTASCSGDLNCNGWLTKARSTLPGANLDELSFDETIVDSSDADYGRVTVKLSWTLPNGAPHSCSATFNVSPSTL